MFPRVSSRHWLCKGQQGMPSSASYLIPSFLQAPSNNAAAPVTNGVAMDVPLIRTYSPFLPVLRMLAPGAPMSTFSSPKLLNSSRLQCTQHQPHSTQAMVRKHKICGEVLPSEEAVKSVPKMAHWTLSSSIHPYEAYWWWCSNYLLTRIQIAPKIGPSASLSDMGNETMTMIVDGVAFGNIICKCPLLVSHGPGC